MTEPYVPLTTSNFFSRPGAPEPETVPVPEPTQQTDAGELPEVPEGEGDAKPA